MSSATLPPDKLTCHFSVHLCLWDPTGPEAETDTFVFPAKRSGEATGQGPSNFAEKQQSTEPLAPGDLQEVEDLLRDDFDDEAAEAIPPRDDLSDWE